MSRTVTRKRAGWGRAALAVVFASAGATDRVEAQMGGEEEVLAAVHQIFEGMRTADPDLVRAVFASDARFASVADGGAGAVSVQSVEGWLDAIGASERRWDERVYEVEVRLDGNMASVWAPYTFYLDGAVRHCGINSIEMLRDAAGWKVTQISDTRRPGTCPDPRGGS